MARVIRVVPFGAIDGDNVRFTLPQLIPAAERLIVSLNGKIQDDFSTSGYELLMAAAPQPGDKFEVFITS